MVRKEKLEAIETLKSLIVVYVQAAILAPDEGMQMVDILAGVTVRAAFDIAARKPTQR